MRGDGNDTAAHQHHIEQVETIVGIALHGIIDDTRQGDDGSREFDDAFETAVRMYPNDPTANLNAANSAMKRGDMEGAGRYLDKAGQSAEAVYARAVYAGLQGNYAKAKQLFSQAQAAGLAAAAEESKRLGNIAQ